ncbi:hypothetical protein AsAng_0005980 [Aureispira anguillae]|uniref:Uncharacterized protein n=1 Tax=Aureispira anguillae TaxID=2864201 RepID=A0A915YB87_9BACT|nr:hypothetical protein AsAng_0005980 [Aureispira anguillae]
MINLYFLIFKPSKLPILKAFDAIRLSEIEYIFRDIILNKLVLI